MSRSASFTRSACQYSGADGAGSHVVNVRSSGPAPLNSIGILVSDPFIPDAASLSFKALSENAAVAPQLLLLKPTANVVNPKPEEILFQADIVNATPNTGATAAFETQKVDLTKFYNTSDPAKGTPMRLEIRQHTTAAGAGYFTLVTNFDAGAVKPLPVGGGTVGKGDVNGDSKVDLKDATLSLAFAVNAKPPTDAQKAAGDVNGDGKLDLKDATLILGAAVGIRTL